MAHATTVSIQKLCVGQLFCVGAALVAAHLRATTRVAPTAAPALSGYEWSQVGVFLLPPLMHRFTVDTVLQSFRLHVSESLVILHSGIELYEPTVEGRKLFSGQFANSSLDLLDSVHTEKLPVTLISSKASGETA